MSETVAAIVILTEGEHSIFTDSHVNLQYHNAEGEIFMRAKFERGYLEFISVPEGCWVIAVPSRGLTNINDVILAIDDKNWVSMARGIFNTAVTFEPGVTFTDLTQNGMEVTGIMHMEGGQVFVLNDVTIDGVRGKYIDVDCENPALKERLLKAF